MSRGGNPGAYSVGDRDRKGGWWKWLLALLAVLAVLALLLLLLNGGDDEESASSGAATTATQPNDSASAASTDGGSLTAEGASLLPVAADGLSTYVGRQAEGQQVRIQAVVEDEGFFVGTSDTDRVYVEYGGDVGENEQQFVPEVGDVVNLTGPVRPAPEDPAQTLNLDRADAQVVEQQGGYVNADSVERVT